MKLPMHKNQSVDLHNFAMIPSANIPRSTFQRQSTHKTTFDGGYLIPIYAEEVLPGDSFSVQMTGFVRLATPLFPVMDNLHMETQFFFVPLRLLWENFVKMMGEQNDPSSSISYVCPTVLSPVNGYAVGSLQDYLGLPTVGQVTAGNRVQHNAFHTRAYNLIYKEWYRDENLQNSPVCPVNDGPDSAANFVLLRRGKRHDYFTSALPWPQKGATAVSLPLGTQAPIAFSAANAGTGRWRRVSDGATNITSPANQWALSTGQAADSTTGDLFDYQPGASLYADLSTATAATINQLRLAFQTQKVLERDARGGTRYTEIIRSHFGVISPDARLQRPEYLGGGSSPVIINPTVQTSGTSASGTTTPMGTLAAVGSALARNHGFTQSFTEHGVILGLLSIRADLTYQQGMRRMFSRSTRYDFYLPAFAMLGEQTVLNKEIYMIGTATGTPGGQDENVFGYQERWAEYRYRPSMITGLFRSTSAGTIDPWHLAQKFTALPTLNSTFIQDTPPIDRVLAVTSTGKQFIGDFFFNERLARPMPMYSVPGLIDHF